MDKVYKRFLEWVVAIALLGGAYFWVGHKAVSDYKAEQEVAQMRANAEQQERYNKVAGELEELKAKRNENAKTIVKEVEKVVAGDVVYRNVCISDDGLQIVNRALSGSGIAASGVPAFE